eukprot:1150295-Pelagomonas_calceolata.AAC.5
MRPCAQDKQGMSTKAADCEEGGECPSSPIAGARLGGLSPHEQLGLTCHALFSHETLTVSDYVFGLGVFSLPSWFFPFVFFLNTWSVR